MTSLVLTNFLPTAQRIEIFQPVMSANAGDCGGPITGFGGPGSIDMAINLEPNQTMTIPFLSPLVFTPAAGKSCIAIAGAPAAVSAYVTGFVN